MNLHFIGQRFRVSRGGCWQCVPDCRSHLAEVLTFSSVAYNGSASNRSAWSGLVCRKRCGYWHVMWRRFLGSKVKGKWKSMKA